MVNVTVLVPASPSVTLTSSIESSGNPDGVVVVVVDAGVTVVVLVGGAVVLVGGPVVVVGDGPVVVVEGGAVVVGFAVVVGVIVAVVVVTLAGGAVVEVTTGIRPQSGALGWTAALHVTRSARRCLPHAERHRLPALPLGHAALQLLSSVRRRLLHAFGHFAADAGDPRSKPRTTTVRMCIAAPRVSPPPDWLAHIAAQCRKSRFRAAIARESHLPSGNGAGNCWKNNTIVTGVVPPRP
jgi:hypothetical protein